MTGNTPAEERPGNSKKAQHTQKPKEETKSSRQLEDCEVRETST